MKGNGFGDRASRLAEWFQDWNSCEQTIALYSLLSKVSATQAKFLSLVLEHSLKNGCDSQELSKLETQANSSTFLKSLHSYAEEEALSQLLSHLPLLHPGKVEARAEYMRLLPKVMLGSSEELDYLDRCRQLLSLALVHPAFPHEDRDALTFWRSQLDQKHKTIADRQGSSPQKPPPIPPRIRQIKTNDDARSSPTSDCIFLDWDLNHTPLDGPGYPSTDPYNADDEEVQQALDQWLPHATASSSSATSRTLQHRQTAPFGFGGSGHTSPQPTSCEDGGMGFREKSNTVPRVSQRQPEDSGGALLVGNLDWKEGMKDVPVWLKSLRLHKYQPLFAELNYEQMLDMDESYLESKNVTKGARNKLILCIRKLVRRPETIQEIEQDMEKHGYLLQCFQELRQMLQTPIKPYNSKASEATPKASRAAKQQCQPVEGSGSGDEEEEGSPSNSPHQHSSSDGGSDLEELLTKDFPQEDLPSLITRAMGKGFSQLMLHTDTNEDNLGAYIKLLDAALQHEVFTLEQKKLFFDWKQQCNQTLRVLSSRKNTRGGRHYGTAYTMPATPRGPVSGVGAYMSGSIPPSKSRSLRGGVAMRNGSSGGAVGKGMSLPAVGRTSSTLPRMSARQLQQPIPHSNPSFLRPNSSFFPSAAIAPTSSSPLVTQSQSFQPAPPPHPVTSSSSSILPPKTCDVSELYMAELCKSVTDHVLPDDLSDN